MNFLRRINVFQLVMLTSCFFAFYYNSFSQSLEHQYSSTVGSLFTISDTEYVYGFVTGNKTFKIYNNSHTLVKTITMPTIHTYDNFYVDNISRNLFDIDSKMELVYRTYDGPADSVNLRIVNEDGHLLFEEKRANQFYLMKVGSDMKFMTMSKVRNFVKVYSLPWTNFSVPENDNPAIESIVYPNPSDDFITIKMDIHGRQFKGELEILDVNGKLIRRDEVNNYLQELKIDVRSFRKGVYFYKIIIKNIESPAKTFIIK